MRGPHRGRRWVSRLFRSRYSPVGILLPGSWRDVTPARRRIVRAGAHGSRHPCLLLFASPPLAPCHVGLDDPSRRRGPFISRRPGLRSSKPDDPPRPVDCPGYQAVAVALAKLVVLAFQPSPRPSGPEAGLFRAQVAATRVFGRSPNGASLVVCPHPTLYIDIIVRRVNQRPPEAPPRLGGPIPGRQP